MATLIKFEFTPEALAKIKAMGELGIPVAAALDRGLLRGAQYIASDVKIAATAALTRRSGSLARDIDAWRIGPLQVAIGVPTNAPSTKYAYLLTDEKKHIVPTPGHKVLAIPIGPLKTDAGVSKSLSPRDFKGFWSNLSGKLIFYGIPEGGQVTKKFVGRLQPLFVGVPSVDVEGRDVLVPTVTANIHKATDEINRELEPIGVG